MSTRLRTLSKKGVVFGMGGARVPECVKKYTKAIYHIRYTLLHHMVCVSQKKKKKNIPILTFQWDGDEFWNVYRGE